MPIQISVHVIDCAQVDGRQKELDVTVIFADSIGPQKHLEGTVFLSEQMKIASIVITKDDLNLGHVDGSEIIRVACESGWNAVVNEEHAVAGVGFQPLATWFFDHAKLHRTQEVLTRIQCIFVFLAATDHRI